MCMDPPPKFYWKFGCVLSTFCKRSQNQNFHLHCKSSDHQIFFGDLNPASIVQLVPAMVQFQIVCTFNLQFICAVSLSFDYLTKQQY